MSPYSLTSVLSSGELASVPSLQYLALMDPAPIKAFAPVRRALDANDVVAASESAYPVIEFAISARDRPAEGAQPR